MTIDTVHPCSWCVPGSGGPNTSHGICRRHYLLNIGQVGLLTPAEAEELWLLLEGEPRAWTAGRISDFLTWSLVGFAVLMLAISTAAWARRDFRIVSTPHEQSRSLAEAPTRTSRPTDKNEGVRRAVVVLAGRDQEPGRPHIRRN